MHPAKRPPRTSPVARRAGLGSGQCTSTTRSRRELGNWCYRIPATAMLKQLSQFGQGPFDSDHNMKRLTSVALLAAICVTASFAQSETNTDPDAAKFVTSDIEMF